MCGAGQGSLQGLQQPWQRPTFSRRSHICLGRGQVPYQGQDPGAAWPQNSSTRTPGSILCNGSSERWGACPWPHGSRGREGGSPGTLESANNRSWGARGGPAPGLPEKGRVTSLRMCSGSEKAPAGPGPALVWELQLHRDPPIPQKSKGAREGGAPRDPEGGVARAPGWTWPPARLQTRASRALSRVVILSQRLEPLSSDTTVPHPRSPASAGPGARARGHAGTPWRLKGVQGSGQL